MEIHTIGFTKRSAADFFGTLKRAGISRLVDIRLHNTSQLAGYTKKDDLTYFMREICNAEYVHQPLLAPTETLLSDYRKKKITWSDYERMFMDLMREREIHLQIPRSLFDFPAVLLCSEDKPIRCHRRLVAEYLRDTWGDVQIKHL